MIFILLVTTIIVDGMAMLRQTYRDSSKLVALATYFVRKGQGYDVIVTRGLRPFRRLVRVAYDGHDAALWARG